MAKLDLKYKLSHRKGKAINRLWYKIMKTFVAAPNAKKMNLEIIRNVDVKKIKGPFIVVSNHTSRCDWQYVGMAMYPQPLNFMASDVEFHRAHMHLIFDLCHVIPKKNFTPDIHTIREILAVIKGGGNIIFFPEGKSSISGTNQPVMLGTSEMLKSLKVPVYSTTIRGGYMSNTQWYIDDRPGKVQIEVNQLFTVEDLEKLSLAEMDERINAAIYNDDFEWNRTQRISYAKTDDICTKLEEHLYWCPKCGAELTMHGEGNTFRCTSCGNGMTVNSMYDLTPLDADCVIPKDLRVWYELQRRRVFRAVRDDPDFRLEENVILGMLPNDHYVDKHVTSEPVGEGKVILTRDEFSFIGTKDGQPFELHNKITHMPTLLLETDSSYFGSYIGGVYYEFKPEHPVTSKWLLAVEECHRAAGGRWQNTLPAQQWIYEDDKDTDRETYYL